MAQDQATKQMPHHGPSCGSGLDGLAAVLAEANGQELTVRPHAPQGRRLGSLSERYESGGRGPGTVSSGLRDPGGVSYGTYQLASRTGTVAAFLSAEGVRWSPRFLGKAPGSKAFDAAWREVAVREPEAFAQAQHGFIERTHYRPLVDAVAARTGLNLDRRADPVRDACWSCAVQHGRAAQIVIRAVAAVDLNPGRNDAGFDVALVRAIYAERCAYLRKIAATADAGTRQTLNAILTNRYPDELARALAMFG